MAKREPKQVGTPRVAPSLAGSDPRARNSARLRLGDGIIVTPDGRIAIDPEYAKDAVTVEAPLAKNPKTGAITIAYEDATLGVNSRSKQLFAQPVPASKVVNDTALPGTDLEDLLTRISAAIAGKMNASRAIKLTEYTIPGEGVEVFESSGGSAPVMRPYSNVGSADLDLRLFGLGTGRVAVDGDYVLHEGEFTTLGGLLVGTGPGTFVELTPGSDGDVLVADSGEPSGLKWAAAASGSASSVSVSVNFGSGSDTASTVVTGQTWVAAGTEFALSAIGEESLIEEVRATVTDIVAGDGFTVLAYAPNGAAGTHTIHVLGI